MKRDADLIRRIALAVEASEDQWPLSRLDNIDPLLFAGHVQLMMDAGLVDARITSFIQPSAEVIRLTMDGHDFLEAARSDTLWKKAKESIIAKGIPWTLDLLKEWLKAEMRNGFPALG